MLSGTGAKGVREKMCGGCGGCLTVLPVSVLELVDCLYVPREISTNARGGRCSSADVETIWGLVSAEICFHSVVAHVSDDRAYKLDGFINVLDPAGTW